MGSALANSKLNGMCMASMPYIVYGMCSSPASTLIKSFVQPTVIYTSSGDFVNVGDDLLTYISDDTLHERTSDGANDVIFEEGIRELYHRRYLNRPYLDPVLR